MDKSKQVSVHLKIPESMLEAIREQVRNGHYANDSEWIRDAIREKLARPVTISP